MMAPGVGMSLILKQFQETIQELEIFQPVSLLPEIVRTGSTSDLLIYSTVPDLSLDYHVLHPPEQRTRGHLFSGHSMQSSFVLAAIYQRSKQRKASGTREA
jgi:hypothetical protein